MRTLFVLILLGLACPGRSDEIPPHILNLARIEHLMTAELKRQFNYTCLETIDRYRALPGGKIKPFDRIRVLVALVEGKELYSWPGAKTFDDRKLDTMVTGGFLSDGEFSAMSHNIFMGRSAEIHFAGPETEGSRNLLRYDFHIPQMMSGWTVKSRGASGVVGAIGSFWVDAGTLDLVRLHFAAEDLPPFSQDKRIEETADYGRVRIGDADALLPLAVELESELFDGSRFRNRATFTGCRQYTAESKISFTDEDAPANAPALPGSVDEGALPGGLSIPLRLDLPIDSQHAAVGDEIRAVVTKAVRFGDQVLLPRGALVKGVIRRLDRHSGNLPYFEVGLEFNEAEYGTHHAALFGKPDEMTPFSGYHRTAIGYATGPPDKLSPGVGYFYVEGESIRIPKGLGFSLQTESARPR